MGFLAQCFEAYYPESLGVALLVNSPWLFSGCWKVISPLLDPVVKSKVQFINSDKLAQFIAPEKTVEIMGGTATTNIKYEPPAPFPPINEEEKNKAVEVLFFFFFLPSFPSLLNRLLNSFLFPPT